MIDDPSLQALALMAYEAATDHSSWPVLLDHLCQAFEASGALLFTPGPPRRGRSLFAVVGHDPAQAPLIEKWAPLDPWVQRRRELALPMPTGMCLVGSDYLPWRELERSDYYNECARHIGVKSVLSLVIEGPGTGGPIPLTNLGLARAPGMPDFGPHEVAGLKALHTPLRRALHSYWAFERLRIAERALEEAIDTMPGPSFVLRRDGGIEHANPAAEALIGPQGLIGVRGRRIVKAAQLDADSIEALCREAAAGQAIEVGLWFSEGEPVRTALMHLTRLPSDGAFGQRWPFAEVLMGIQRDDPERARAGRVQAITARCALTRCEAEVFALLARGVALDEIAATQGVRISTVRTHVRHLLEKTHTRRMIDLLGLLVD